MPSATTTKKMLLPLLKRRPELELYKRNILITPIRSIFRGIFFERCSDPDVYLPYICVAPLACAGSFPGASIGNYFVRPEKLPKKKAIELYGPGAARETMSRLWRIDDPDYPDAMISAVEATMLPVPESLTTLDRLSGYLDGVIHWHDEPQVSFMKAWINVMHGRFGGMAQNRFNHARTMLDRYKPGLADRLLELGDDLPIDDKQSIIRILHECEAEAIKAMNLEKHWIPTPFPAEENGLV